MKRHLFQNIFALRHEVDLEYQVGELRSRLKNLEHLLPPYDPRNQFFEFLLIDPFDQRFFVAFQHEHVVRLDFEIVQCLYLAQVFGEAVKNEPLNRTVFFVDAFVEQGDDDFVGD